MNEQLIAGLAGKIQDSKTISGYSGTDYNLEDMMQCIYSNRERSEELSSFNQRLAEETRDINYQVELIEEFNAFIIESCEWYVERYYGDLEQQYRLDQEIDQARYAEGL